MPTPAARAAALYNEALQAQYGHHPGGLDVFTVINNASQDRDAFVHFSGHMQQGMPTTTYPTINRFNREMLKEHMKDWQTYSRESRADAVRERAANWKGRLEAIGHVHNGISEGAKAIGNSFAQAVERMHDTLGKFEGANRAFAEANRAMTTSLA